MSDNVVALSTRDRVALIKEKMLAYKQREIPIKHYFSPGVYAREITIPPDTYVAGRIHKFAQLNILSSGEISILGEDGWVHLKAPFTVVSPPGTERFAYAHTECTWTTILHTKETDPDKIEELFTVATDQEYLKFVHDQRLIGEK